MCLLRTRLLIPKVKGDIEGRLVGLEFYFGGYAYRFRTWESYIAPKRAACSYYYAALADALSEPLGPEDRQGTLYTR